METKNMDRARILVFVISGVSVLTAAVMVYLVCVFMMAPSISILDAAPKWYRTSVLDTDGNVALTLSGEESNRVYVSLSEIPDDLQHAFVAIEDERFYEHGGIDVYGICRAFVRGVIRGRFNEGASTITQQLLKNNVFEEWTSETSFAEKVERKLQEQFLAVCLERKVTKDWILENYLSTINLGGGNWGVETAARYYFNKDVSELTLSESAVLAAITKNPTTYNPRKNPENNAARREIVLDKMLEQGYITPGERDEAMADPVYDRIAQAATDNSNPQEIMSYFEDALLYTVVSDLMNQKGCSEEEAWDLVYRGGLTVYSTENSRLQAICEEEANRSEYFSADPQVSLVILDTNTGAVCAMVGGRGAKEANLVLNRATMLKRQPGSTIKVIGEYAAGIENGAFTLGTTIDDASYTYSDGTEIVNSDGRFEGMTTVHEAITRSCNIVALKCFQELGMDTVWSSLSDFGITTLTDEDRVEALALGGTYGGVTNLEMTAAYGTLARGGEYIEPVYYTKIVDRSGQVLLEKVPEKHQVVTPETAALLTVALEDVLDSGTGVDANFDNMSLAGKSGTTNDVRDSWFIGYSPYLTCGIWGGNDDNSAQESGDYVKTIWKSVMSRAHESLANAEFASTGQLVKCIICTKCGKIAVTGLCDVTEQGDMTAVEYYAEGTEPTEECDCHVAVEVCTSSGEKAGSYCPNSKRHVYLRSATEGTEDAAYVIPDNMKGSHSCSEHTSMWSQWWNNHNGSNGNSHGNDSGSGHSGNSGSNGNSGGSWWSDFWNGGSDNSGNGSSGGSGNGGYDEGNGSGGYDGNSGSGRDDNGNSDGYGSGREDSGGSNDNSGQDWWDWLFGA